MAVHRVISPVRDVPNLVLAQAFHAEFGSEETWSETFSTAPRGERPVLRKGDVPRVVEVNLVGTS